MKGRIFISAIIIQAELEFSGMLPIYPSISKQINMKAKFIRTIEKILMKFFPKLISITEI